MPKTDAERKAWLGESIRSDAAAVADHYRDTLIELYGDQRGNTLQYAEAYEISEYTLHLEQHKLDMIIPFFKEQLHGD